LSEPEAALRVAADRLREAASKEDLIRFSAAEFFADRTRLRYFNSQGVNVLQEARSSQASSCCWPKGRNPRARSFRPSSAAGSRTLTWLGREGGLQLGSQADRGCAPKTGTFDVVFSREALDHFFNWFSTQASAAAKYNRMSRAEIGAPLCPPGPGASPLTLWHNAVIPYAVGSYRVDPSGSSAGRRILVDSGKLKSRWSQARYAQYLSAEPTGELGNIEVEPGAYSEADLLKPENGKPLYHLFDFSYSSPMA